MRSKPLLLVLSGPSGVGKDSIVSSLKKRGLSLYFLVTTTTRPPRPREKEGVDYYFLSAQEFEELKAKNGLAEWAQVYGHYYGVPKKNLDQALAQGQDVLLKVDVQGATTIKRLYPQAKLIFVAPPSVEELGRRLQRRGTEPAHLNRRLETAVQEMSQIPLFDYQVVNHRVEEAVAQIEAIITAERCQAVQE